MAGAILERELTAAPSRRFKFEIAGQADDPEIRRLLHENPMPGRISLSLEREPNYFIDAKLPGEVKQTIVSRDGGRLICVGCCTIRPRFVNGKPWRVGYLGGLRLDGPYAGRFDILRRGYEFFRELQVSSPAELYFTSIATDNLRARKVLERALPGMPRYEFIGDFVTAFVSADTNRSKHKHPVGFVHSPAANELVPFLNDYNQGYQLAPCWSTEELTALSALGLQTSDFLMLRNSERLAACGALWDQRNFKQTVIRNYAPWLALARPAFNACARMTKRPCLPAVGEPLANLFISHLAFQTDTPNALIDLVSKLRDMARQRKIQFLTLGFAANDVRLAMLRNQFHFREYRSRLYVVRWPQLGGSAAELDRRSLAPEVALL